jgi:chaperone required for assembly of F1-ATPase
MKRFYEKVTVESVGGGFNVSLDEKSILTPRKNLLLLPNRTLAEAIASEWRTQGEAIRPSDMPMMSLASTVIDRLVPQKIDVINSIVAYAQTDLLCYRAPEPNELIRRQCDIWDPLLYWAKIKLNADFSVTTGIMPLEQPKHIEITIRAAVVCYDAFTLIALHELTAISGSIVIGLAIIEGGIEVGDGIVAAQLDTLYQIERWGEDTEGTLKLKTMRREMLDAANFIVLLER